MNNKLSNELSRLRREIEELQEDCLSAVVPEDVRARIEVALDNLGELVGALREAGL